MMTLIMLTHAAGAAALLFLAGITKDFLGDWTVPNRKLPGLCLSLAYFLVFGGMQLILMVIDARQVLQ